MGIRVLQDWGGFRKNTLFKVKKIDIGRQTDRGLVLRVEAPGGKTVEVSQEHITWEWAWGRPRGWKPHSEMPVNDITDASGMWVRMMRRGWGGFKKGSLVRVLRIERGTLEKPKLVLIVEGQKRLQGCEERHFWKWVAGMPDQWQRRRGDLGIMKVRLRKKYEGLPEGSVHRVVRLEKAGAGRRRSVVVISGGQEVVFKFPDEGSVWEWVQAKPKDWLSWDPFLNPKDMVGDWVRDWDEFKFGGLGRYGDDTEPTGTGVVADINAKPGPGGAVAAVGSMEEISVAEQVSVGMEDGDGDSDWDGDADWEEDERLQQQEVHEQVTVAEEEDGDRAQGGLSAEAAANEKSVGVEDDVHADLDGVVEGFGRRGGRSEAIDWSTGDASAFGGGGEQKENEDVDGVGNATSSIYGDSHGEQEYQHLERKRHEAGTGMGAWNHVRSGGRDDQRHFSHGKPHAAPQAGSQLNWIEQVVDTTNQSFPHLDGHGHEFSHRHQEGRREKSKEGAWGGKGWRYTYREGSGSDSGSGSADGNSAWARYEKGGPSYGKGKKGWSQQWDGDWSWAGSRDQGWQRTWNGGWQAASTSDWKRKPVADQEKGKGNWGGDWRGQWEQNWTGGRYGWDGSEGRSGRRWDRPAGRDPERAGGR